MEDLGSSLSQYENQLAMVQQALDAAQDNNEREPLIALQSELQELIDLTKESLDAQGSTGNVNDKAKQNPASEKCDVLDDEYALFMKEMSDSGAYAENKGNNTEVNNLDNNNDHSDIEDELASLQGMKCSVYHTHAWGGQPSLHNAMVSSVEPRQDDDKFNDLKVKVLYTHPTHAEMLPCPFYLNGECKFSDEQCRYSHGALVQLSDLKEAIEPDYDNVRVGSRVLIKLKPPDDEDMSTAKKSTEKYHLWHTGIVKSVDTEKRLCVVKLEYGVKTGEKRKSASDEMHVLFEDIFPLSSTGAEDTSSDDSLSDTEYPDNKIIRAADNVENNSLLIEKSLQNNGPAMGEWERHTRGIGSKIMLSMGYVPGTGLGAAGDGRLRPVEARALPVGASLDHCMAISEKHAGKDPLRVEQKLKKLQKKEEERNKRAYEREKERERRNVFNFLNNTLGDKAENSEQSASAIDIKQSTSKDLNIEKFKIEEDCRKIEAEVLKLNNSLAKYPQGTNGHRSITMQIIEKNKELTLLRNKEKQIDREQKQRKDKQKMTVF